MGSEQRHQRRDGTLLVVCWWCVRGSLVVRGCIYVGVSTLTPALTDDDDDDGDDDGADDDNNTHCGGSEIGGDSGHDNQVI